MAKRDQSGLAPLILVGIIGIAVGKCSGGSNDANTAPQALISSSDAAIEAASTTLYVQTRSLNCRASPMRKSPILAKFRRGEQVTITRYERDWALVPRAPDPDCWVARQNLTDTTPSSQSPAMAAVPVAASTRNLIERAEDGPSCGAKWKCGQMNSCEEANFYLNQCGLGRLDGDGDGVPCESIC